MRWSTHSSVVRVIVVAATWIRALPHSGYVFCLLRFSIVLRSVLDLSRVIQLLNYLLSWLLNLLLLTLLVILILLKLLHTDRISWKLN